MQAGRSSPSPLAIPRRDEPAPPLSAVQPYNQSAVFENNPPNESRLLLGYLRVLLSNKGLLLLLASAGLLAGLALSYFQTPVFHASASVEIQGLNGDYLNLKAFDPTTAFQDFSPEGEILTQAKIMQRDDLLERRRRRSQGARPQEQRRRQAALDYASGTWTCAWFPGPTSSNFVPTPPTNRSLRTSPTCGRRSTSRKIRNRGCGPRNSPRTPCASNWEK